MQEPLNQIQGETSLPHRPTIKVRRVPARLLDQSRTHRKCTSHPGPKRSRLQTVKFHKKNLGERPGMVCQSIRLVVFICFSFRHDW